MLTPLILAFSWSYILFAVAYLAGLSQYLIRGRRRMMVVRTCSSGLWVLYLYLLGGYAGAAASVIATIGCFIQAVVPDHLLEKTKVPRIAVAVTLAGAAALACARSAGDLLPLTAVILGRFFEVQASQQRIRMCMLLCQFLWVAYHWNQGYIMLYLAENIAILVNLYAIWNHERRQQEPVPVAAPV